MEHVDKIQFKKDLIQKCKLLITKNSEIARAAMQEHQQLANDYGQPKDRYDSFRTQMLRKRDMFAIQYQKALDELALYEKIDAEKIHTNVSFGCVVITDKQKLFVATSLGKITIENRDFYAISAAVPIFEKMKGLKVGSLFSFNGQNFTITELF
ncbi:MAG TPA: hypothetical protein DDX39_05625 [Bacteroidales bacterium]|nr:MAG: hypothetical protein A2W98_06895 [Bacteroidetes bacterium GWF2_33_38]OFY76169.1 MAG: hypothetical protein A2265_09565 [Bacteroidetes bacterium RIFOXYA12_FULL_33_9]HBF88103.1 hypothetical protein [Bacteroidales bacterium]